MTNHYSYLVVVELDAFPTLTAAGVVYAPPVADYNANYYCQRCPHLELCQFSVAHEGYALCEKVLESELLPESVLKQMEALYV